MIFVCEFDFVVFDIEIFQFHLFFDGKFWLNFGIFGVDLDGDVILERMMKLFNIRRSQHRFNVQ